MRVAIVGTKGGVGKTTTTAGLAAAAARAGRRVAVVDLDAQRSFTRWTAEAADDGVQVPWVLVDRADDAADVTLVDTGPGDVPALRRALVDCDLAVTPCGPSPLEVEQLPELLALAAQAGRDVIVAPSRVRTGTRSAADLLAGLDAADLLRTETSIPLREAVGGWFGTVPGGPEGDGDLHGFDTLWAEVAGWWKAQRARARKGR